LYSVSVTSNKNIEIIGAIDSDPGFIYQTPKNREINRLNIKNFKKGFSKRFVIR